MSNAADGRADQTDAPPASRRDDLRRRITLAAMDLFEENGYAATTVDSIADRAGIARRTFFHQFASKDGVVFAGHETLIDRVQEHLANRGHAAAMDAINDSLRMIMTSYVEDRDLAVRRYALTRITPELREREVAWVQRYQVLFCRFLDQCYRVQGRTSLAAEADAAAMVALHNHVLRQWLKGGGRTDALAELAEALDWFAGSASTSAVERGDRPSRIVVAVFDADVEPRELSRSVLEARDRLV